MGYGLDYEEFDELSLLSLALLSSRLSRLIWKAKNGKLKTFSINEIKILQEGKKFILRAKDGSIADSISAKKKYLPDIESVKAYDLTRGVWPSAKSLLDKLNVYEEVFNYIEQKKGLLDKKDSNEIKKKLDKTQIFFIRLNSKLIDLVDEVNPAM